MEPYIIYDHNVNISEMLKKCPNAKLIGTGIIKDYELSFRGTWYCAYATIERKRGSYVPAVMWELDKFDKSNLDIFQGCPSVNIKSYTTMQMDNGHAIEASVYLMNSGQLNLPSSNYFKMMQQGYEDFGLDIRVFHDTVININDLLKNEQPYLQLTL